MKNYQYITLRQKPEWMLSAAEWFHNKWGVPTEAYLECMEAYLQKKTEYGWYLCLNDNQIVGGLGVIENDFHDRKDLTPNVCAVYTEEQYRKQQIAGNLLHSGFTASGACPKRHTWNVWTHFLAGKPSLAGIFVWTERRSWAA